MKKYILNIKGLLGIDILFSLIAAVCTALIPNFEKELIDKLLKLKHGDSVFFRLAVIFIACTVAICIFSYVSNIFEIKWKMSMRNVLQRDFFDSLIGTDYRTFKKKSIGEYISIETNNIEVVVEEYLQQLVSIVKAAIKILVYTVVMYLCIDVRIAFIICIMSLMVVFTPKIFEAKNEKLGNASMEAVGKYTSSVKDHLEGIKLINHVTRRSIINEHNRAVNKMNEIKIKRGIFGMFSMAFEVFSLKAMELVIFITVAVLLLFGELTVGMVLAVFSYSTFFIDPLQDILRNIDFINSRKGIKEEFVKAISLNDREKKSLHKLVSFKDGITIDNVCVSYDKFKLNNVCCQFEKGKKYAIIGHSGSGKSTLINLLMKYEVPGSGKISIDGLNIEDINTDDIIACINQNEHMYKENFENNVTVFGSYSSKVLENMRNKYDKDMLETVACKEDCSKLSGGEKQLTSFIRSLAGEKEILIMDEPFSAMDAGTSKKVMNALLELKDKTIIMITHKLDEDLKKFDEVILMGDGSIIYKGEFDKAREYLIH